MKRLLSLRLHPAAWAALAAFSCVAAPSRAQSATHSSPEPPAFREVVDELGRSIRIPQQVRRIVSLSPSSTETIYALGLQDRLVGDTDYCDYPPDAQKKTKVGGAINPSLEVIASLRPDLVLVTRLNRLETTQSLAELGIPSYATDPRTVADILSSVKTLANVLGAPEAGSSVAEQMQRRLSDLHHRLGDLPPKRVLFVVWTQVNLEEIARLQPDFLVFADAHPENVTREVERLATLPGWKILHAIRDGRYAVISDAVNRPAPRIVSAIEDLARQMHPEAFVEKPGDPKKENEKERPAPYSTAFPTSLNSAHLLHSQLNEGGCACGL